ncbi:MAG: hypothetical protein JWL81_1800 [Verrucomicrobiales bacterium]|nr:hypothetical protein [Verrucomicrobiales bacterium]
MFPPLSLAILPLYALLLLWVIMILQLCAMNYYYGFTEGQRQEIALKHQNRFERFLRPVKTIIMTCGVYILNFAGKWGQPPWLIAGISGLWLALAVGLLTMTAWWHLRGLRRLADHGAALGWKLPAYHSIHVFTCIAGLSFLGIVVYKLARGSGL